MSTNVYTLTNVLQQLLTPADTAIDPNETSEVIKTDFATITTVENVQKDPLGAGVEPTWVLGTYHPSGIADTKRVICINRDSAVLL